MLPSGCSRQNSVISLPSSRKNVYGSRRVRSASDVLLRKHRQNQRTLREHNAIALRQAHMTRCVSLYACARTISWR